jgi:hypothetical protein
MSLTVRAVQILEQTRTIPIEGAPRMTAAGFESWRTAVWASSAVISLAEAVRRPRPSRLILPSLATQDILVEGEELDQLEREVDALLARALEVVKKIRLTAPMLGGILDGSGTPRTPSEPEILEHFRDRLLNIKEAIQLARTVPRGGVKIG